MKQYDPSYLPSATNHPTTRQVTAVKKWWKQHRNAWEISQLTGISEAIVTRIVHDL